MKRKHIVFLTGAGISAESGLNTFRGKDGLWTQEEFMYYASTECLFLEPEKCLAFYNMRRKKLSEVEPNEAHRLIAELEKNFEVTVVTQNVDDLHERAGSSRVIHLHGELTKVCSSRNMYDPKYIKEYPLTMPINVGDDAGDGSQLRPYIVMFGEYVFTFEVAQEVVESADIFVLVGTSLQVYPANNLILHIKNDAPKYVIDPSDMPSCDKLGFTHYKSIATEGMKRLVDELESTIVHNCEKDK